MTQTDAIVVIIILLVVTAALAFVGALTDNNELFDTGSEGLKYVMGAIVGVASSKFRGQKGA